VNAEREIEAKRDKPQRRKDPKGATKKASNMPVLEQIKKSNLKLIQYPRQQRPKPARLLLEFLRAFVS
jgi:hypothetical protein